MEFPIVPRLGLADATAALEGMWSAFDTIYGSFSDADWQRPYGKDWRYADQPFHMAYFDREVLNVPLEEGASLSDEGRWSFGSVRGMNDWNAREFAKRPADETPARSVERMHEEHDRLRTILSKLVDDRLDATPVWQPPFGQMGTARDSLMGAIVHNWGELVELRFRAKREDVPIPELATKVASSFYVSFMGLLAKPENATSPFGLTVALTGPGGGTYGIRVADGRVDVHEGPESNADVSIRTTPNEFNIVMVRQAINPMVAMLTGKVKIKGITKMGRMRKVFPEPKPHEPFTFPG